MLAGVKHIEGFVCEGVSDGERLCTGCWDRDGMAVADIQKGEPLYWRRASVEYDEWDVYCAKCAAEFHQ